MTVVGPRWWLQPASKTLMPSWTCCFKKGQIPIRRVCYYIPLQSFQVVHRSEADLTNLDHSGQVWELRRRPNLARCQVNMNNCQTVIHFVASKNNLDLARKLFDQKPPASARVRDKRGQYALHRAAAVGSVPMVQLLLQNKSPLNATDSSGYTALHHAVAEGHGKIINRPYYPQIWTSSFWVSFII